ncbi:MAG: methyltransferase domain-containing protein [Lysobacterales bacterium]|nr:MAG: methyltransferase domain-containing protein [Xanthomonadales bacterium]
MQLTSRPYSAPGQGRLGRSALHRIPALMEKMKGNWATLNPEDARELDLKKGQRTRIATAVGSREIEARSSPAARVDNAVDTAAHSGPPKQVRPTSDPVKLYSDRTDSYVRLVRFVRYPQGLRAYFLRSSLLGSGLRVLDAGCGTGIVTLALRDALLRRGLVPGPVHAFDLTAAMLERFRATLREREIEGIDLAEANVLELDGLAEAWSNYDLIVSASMFEYLPRSRLSTALAGLRSLLKEGGSFVLFITRRNWLTRPLIGRWWRSNFYAKSELEQAFRDAGFTSITFASFPPLYRYLALWGYIVEARR